jgi:3-deoxy-D-manno-octulosonic-acid transferase
MLYRVTSVAVIGGSFLPGLAGHNISEAAAAGCAVVTGKSKALIFYF